MSQHVIAHILLFNQYLSWSGVISRDSNNDIQAFFLYIFYINFKNIQVYTHVYYRLYPDFTQLSWYNWPKVLFSRISPERNQQPYNFRVNKFYLIYNERQML